MKNIFKRIWNYFLGREICRYCLGQKQMMFKGKMTNCPACHGKGYHFLSKKDSTSFDKPTEFIEFSEEKIISEGKFTIETPIESASEETIIPPAHEFKDVSKQNNLIPERFEGESFAEYKKRQILAKLFLKQKQKGTVVFESQKAILDKVGKIKGFTKGQTFKGDTSKLK